jgi:hypothetical protein
MGVTAMRIANGSGGLSADNIKQHCGIKYWEIGNVLFGVGTFETDFHPAPGDGASDGAYEGAFYDETKRLDTHSLMSPSGDEPHDSGERIVWLAARGRGCYFCCKVKDSAAVPLQSYCCNRV